MVQSLFHKVSFCITLILFIQQLLVAGHCVNTTETEVTDTDAEPGLSCYILGGGEMERTGKRQVITT